MGITLIINPGSSSKKYTLYRETEAIASFRFERMNERYEVCRDINGINQHCEGLSSDQFNSALKQVIDYLLNNNVISSIPDITTVGVRIVSPGSYFARDRVIDESYLIKLREREGSAPLHIPPTVKEIDQLRLELPEAVIVGVSDSAFHSTLPEFVRTPAIDLKDVTNFDLYRFGYHGLSVQSVVSRTPQVFGLMPSRMIVCHIGSGMSMTAVKDGVSVDTTMGFGPGSGLMMGTRTGDIDPSTLLELMRVKNMKVFDAQLYTQLRGGFIGQTGESDFRQLLDRLANEDKNAENAFMMCRYQLQKTLGAFFVALGGLDAIVLTATAMERSPFLRSLLLCDLSCIGVNVSDSQNDKIINNDGVISSSDSNVKVAVIRTNESLELLDHTLKLSQQNQST